MDGKQCDPYYINFQALLEGYGATGTICRSRVLLLNARYYKKQIEKMILEQIV